MAGYFYAWTPLVVVGAVLLLALPWLALIALMIVSLVAVAALAALAWAVVFVPYPRAQPGDQSPAAQPQRRESKDGAGAVAGQAPKRVAHDLQ